MSNVFLIGVFDLYHEGHINLLKNASKLGDNLYVGVVKDASVRREKGEDRPVFDEKHRLAIIENNVNVQQAFLIDDFNVSELYKKVDSKSLVSYSTSIIVRGEDQNHVKGFEELKAKGCLVVTLERTEGVSTTKLVDKIK